MPWDDSPNYAVSRPVFPGGEKAASKRLNRFLDDTGVKDGGRKVIHSLQHRAQDLLRAAEESRLRGEENP
jgi:hypothetical protein